MKQALAILALGLVPAAALAQPAPESDSFRTRVSAIGTDPAVAGQWVDLLPVIADRCDMAVDQNAVAAAVRAFAIPTAVDQAADYYAGRHGNPLRTAWVELAHRDQDEACRLADSLWGSDGSQFPGLLHEPE